MMISFPFERRLSTWKGRPLLNIPWIMISDYSPRHWKELGIQGDCPFHFTQDELNSHLVDSEGWNEVHDFFDSIEGLVKRDGWTHHETFDAALEFFSNLRKLGLKDMKDEEREKFEKQTRWAKSRN